MPSLLLETERGWPADPIVCRMKGLGKHIYFRISSLQTMAP